MTPIKLWLHIILSTLNHVSDREYQERVWNQGLGIDIGDSYIETMCNLFDEGAVRAFIDYHAAEAGLNYQQVLELKRIVDLIDKYDGSKLSHEDLLKDKKWIAITEEAKKALKILPKDTYVGENR